MSSVILQLQLLLGALSALLPLVPAATRISLGAILDVASKALSIGESAAGDLTALAQKLAAVRAEVEAMAAAGRDATPDELDAAIARIHAASDAFHAALETAGAAN
jgi:hypothetical protein